MSIDLANVGISFEAKGANTVSSTLKSIDAVLHRLEKSIDLMVNSFSNFTKSVDAVSKLDKAINTFSVSEEVVTKATKEMNISLNGINEVGKLNTKTLKDESKALEDFINKLKNCKKVSDTIAGDSAGRTSVRKGRATDITNTFNTANIAAQVQDVVVTSAMGMNPITIALQQGTQLSSILNLTSDSLANLKKAFLQLINPTSLVTIGLIGLSAAGIQMVDWLNVGKGVLNGLASVMEFVGNNTDILLSAVLALAGGYAYLNREILLTVAGSIGKFLVTIPGLIAGMYASASAAVVAAGGFSGLAASVWAAVSGFVAMAAPVLAIVGGLAAVTYGILKLTGTTDVVGKKLKEFSNAIKEFTNELGVSKKSAKELAESWDKLVSGASDKISELEFQISLLGKVGYELEYMKAKHELVNKAVKEGIVLDEAQNKLINEKAQEIATLTLELNTQKDAYTKLNNVGKSWLDMQDNMTKSIEGLRLESSYVGKNVYEIERLRKENELLNRAYEQGILIKGKSRAGDADKIKQIQDYAKEYSALKKSIDDSNKSLKLSQERTKAFDDLTRNSDNAILKLQTEAEYIGLVGYQANYTAERFRLLNEMRSKGIDLTPDEISLLEQEADRIATMRTKVDGLKDTFEFSKGTMGSFFKDMRHGLQDGESAWDSFANAVTNALNRILDKMTDIGTDYLMMALKQGATSYFGSPSGQMVYDAPIGPTMPQANGGAWYHGVQMFARGGVVGSPTLFGTSRGLGLMGEAGPEAIMPLTRSSDGSLGVRADGFGGSSNVVVNVVNNSNAQADVQQRKTADGVEIDVIIDQIVADKLSKQGTASNSALNSWNNRQLIAR